MSDAVRNCRTCGRPENDHPFRHAFVANGALENTGLTHVDENDQSQSSPASSNPSSQERVRIAPAGDPVLRLALMRAGIITVADLDAIDAELRASGVAGHDPGPLG